MATTSTTPTTITVDVTKDLESLSDLQALFAGQRAAIFEIGSEVARFAGQPIQSLVGSNPAKFSLLGDHSWELPLGISFSLKPTASCTLAVSNTSAKFSIQKNIDADETTEVSAGPTNGTVYVNIDLDFDITGNLSGSGTVSGIGIAGKASGAASATLSYCHPVKNTLETVAAVKAAFNALSFPFNPGCAIRMPTGSIGKVSFAASLNSELNLSYGFGSYKFSAHTLGAASDSIELGPEKLKAPDVTVDAGAKASISYTHSDNFTVIVTKSNPNTAMVHLLRAADTETGQSVGITVGISSSSVSATIDTQKLAQAIANQVKAAPPALADGLASGISCLQDNLVSKANNFLSSHKGDAGLLLSLSQQRSRTVLFNFRVDLAAAGGTLAQQSWTAMVKGNLGAALRMGGFKLLEDSGIAESLKQSSAIQLHFFSFQLAKQTDFFRNSVVKLGPDGSIRFFANVGEQSKYTVSHKSTRETIHFVATADEENWGGKLKDVEVDFYIELSETNNSAEANRIASTVGAISANVIAQSAQHKMLDYVVNNRDKTLTLISVFKSSAYGKLTCSPYSKDPRGKNVPPALPQRLDKRNWEAFQLEVESLMHDLTVLVSDLNYRSWMDWNVYINYQIGDQPDENHVPDRRGHGNDLEAARRLFGNDKGNRSYPFLEASTGFMNLCDDLHSLATKAAEVTTEQGWANLLNTLEKWVKGDTDPDWSKPALGALLNLCSLGSVPQVEAAFQQAKDNSSFTCTLTVS